MDVSSRWRGQNRVYKHILVWNYTGRNFSPLPATIQFIPRIPICLSLSPQQSNSYPRTSPSPSASLLVQWWQLYHIKNVRTAVTGHLQVGCVWVWPLWIYYLCRYPDHIQQSCRLTSHCQHRLLPVRVCVCVHTCVGVSLISGCPCRAPHLSLSLSGVNSHIPNTGQPVLAVGSNTHGHTHACSESPQLFSVFLLSNWQTLSRLISSTRAVSLFSSLLPSDWLPPPFSQLPTLSGFLVIHWPAAPASCLSPHILTPFFSVLPLPSRNPCFFLPTLFFLFLLRHCLMYCFSSVTVILVNIIVYSRHVNPFVLNTVITVRKFWFPGIWP